MSVIQNARTQFGRAGGLRRSGSRTVIDVTIITTIRVTGFVQKIATDPGRGELSTIRLNAFPSLLSREIGPIVAPLSLSPYAARCLLSVFQRHSPPTHTHTQTDGPFSRSTRVTVYGFFVEKRRYRIYYVTRIVTEKETLSTPGNAYTGTPRVFNTFLRNSRRTSRSERPTAVVEIHA